MKVGHHTKKSSSKKDHREPAGKNNQMDAFSTEKIRVVDLSDEAGCLVMRYLHRRCYNYSFHCLWE